MLKNNTKGMSVVHEGWLTKSPPIKRVWKAKWRRRWFRLRYSTDSPAHYYLDYYTDKDTRKLKGTIDLNSCHQIDAGLSLGRDDNPAVFSIQTHSRIYHLEADCVTDMEKWVALICKACGMKDVQSETPQTHVNENESNEQTTSHQESNETSSADNYISLYTCSTGPRSVDNVEDVHKDLSNALARNEIINRNRSIIAGSSFSRSCNDSHENSSLLNSNKSDRSSFASNGFSNPNSPSYGLTNKFTSLTLSDNNVNPTTPIPPRPPKPIGYMFDPAYKESNVGPRLYDPAEDIAHEFIFPELKTNNTQNRAIYMNIMLMNQITQRNPMESYGHSSGASYYNFKPPIINRELKPGRVRSLMIHNEKEPPLPPKINIPPTLEYIDLDLDSLSSYSSTHNSSGLHSPTNYRTVDFVKTNILGKMAIEIEKNSHRN